MQIHKIAKRRPFAPADVVEQNLHNIFTQAGMTTQIETITIPESTNFSSMGKYLPDSEEFEFDVEDEGASADNVVEKIHSELTLLSLLSNFNDRDKIILLFQVVRESGYDLTHQECAKTLSITRERYMTLLKRVKRRAAKILQKPLV